MKSLLVINFFLIVTIPCLGQQIGDYKVEDSLIAATHPSCSEGSNKYILGIPNDSCWVNISNNLEFEGLFSSKWKNKEGPDIVIESAFDADKYDIELILADNSYSMTYTNEVEDWITLETINMDCISEIGLCLNYNFSISRQIITLDFITNFGLLPDQEIIGIKIRFGYSDQSDISGVYIVDICAADPTDPCNCILEEDQVSGCTDPSSCNYNPDANCDDNSCLPMPVCNTDICAGDTEIVDPTDLCSCIVDQVQMLGCTDPTACNYDLIANCDDGTCMALPSFNTDLCDGDIEMLDPEDPCNIILVTPQVFGCTDATACNYDPDANCDDGSCLEAPVCNTDPCVGDIEIVDPSDPCGCIMETLQMLGCLDPEAINYDPNANCDDGSCRYQNVLFLPNIISVNAPYPDNSIVVTPNRAITNLSITVYDRWGGKVSEANYITFVSEVVLWDGLCYLGNCEQGVYLYFIEYELNGEPTQVAGDITFVR